MALIGLALAGCGDDVSQKSQTPTATPQRATSTPAPEAAITISAPRDGATVEASVKVAGKADPGTTVLLDGGCDGEGCRAIALADTAGRWSHELRLEGGGRATITASTASSEPLDEVTVRVASAPEPDPGKVPDLPDLPQDIPTAGPSPDTVFLVGDSLAVGIEDLLPQALPSKTIRTDALTGRPLADGMRIIRGLNLTSQPSVLAVSLFTNDGPAAVDGLEAAVEETLTRVGGDGCAVWATIVRPPVSGISYAAANDRLRALAAQHAPRLQLVPWAETIARRPSLLAPDGVHGTPEGYQVRAQLYAQAIEACGA